MKCPTCKGTSKILEASQRHQAISCNDCAGTGKIDDAYPLRLVKGKQMREERLRQNLGLREYCLKFQIDPVIRSKQERGIIA